MFHRVTSAHQDVPCSKMHSWLGFLETCFNSSTGQVAALNG